MFRTRKKFGQHFLNSEQVLTAICHAILDERPKRCIEIGPGQGELTRYLLETDMQIHAVEIDQRLVPTLDKLVKKHSNFSYILQDVMMCDFSELDIQAPLSVVGNLPYEISTPLLFKLIEWRENIVSMVFLLQKEVVDRIVAPVGSRGYGRISVMLQYYFEVEGLQVVPPEAFSPPPKVMSQVVRLKPKQRQWVSHKSLSEFVKFLFAQQRKMLRQRFKPYLEEKDWQDLGLESSIRPAEIDIDSILKMLALLQKKGFFLADSE